MVVEPRSGAALRKTRERSVLLAHPTHRNARAHSVASIAPSGVRSRVRVRGRDELRNPFNLAQPFSLHSRSLIKLCQQVCLRFALSSISHMCVVLLRRTGLYQFTPTLPILYPRCIRSLATALNPSPMIQAYQCFLTHYRTYARV